MSEGQSTCKRVWNSKNSSREPDDGVDIQRGRFQLCIWVGLQGIFSQQSVLAEDRLSYLKVSGNGLRV